MGWMTRFFLLFLFAGLFFWAGIQGARAGSYPHYLQSGLECGSCHSVHGGQPKLIWEQAAQQDIDHTPMNQLCWSCHNDTDAPAVLTHSSLQTTDKYGNWTVECVVCHEPHFQLQPLTYPGAYLVQGTVAAVDATTLTKSGPADWTPDAYRGMLLIPDRNRMYTAYRIVGNSGDTLTVDPDTSTPQVDGSMDLSQVSPGSTFVICRGRLIRDRIDLGRIQEYASTTLPLPEPTYPKSGFREVRFFRDAGPDSFADGDATYTGICEVCHTQTGYHRYGGGGAAHSGGTDCLSCHGHSAGFIHGGGSGAGCESCHGHDAGYEYAPGEFSEGAGTVQSHSTHTENDADDLKGPNIGCDVCHDTDNYPYFKSGTDTDGDGLYSLTETDVCDNCHSPGGVFDGVTTSGDSIGARDNWSTGVYEGTALAAGKEKWCAGCHDDQPAYSMAETVIPVIVDDPDAEFVCSWPWTAEAGYYGTGSRYHSAGDGSCTATWTPDLASAGDYKVYAWWATRGNRATDAPYTVNYEGGSDTVRMDQRKDWDQWNYLGTWPFAAGTSGSVMLSDDGDFTVTADAVKFDGPGTYAPNVIGDNTSYGFYVTGHKISCLHCHDTSRHHIDHEHRTYAADENTYQAINPYCDSFRLKDIDGLECMIIPRPLRGAGANPLNAWQDFALCFSCHDRYEVLSQTGSPDATNFWNNDASPANSHNIHLGISSYHFDSDFDSGHGIFGSERNDSSETCIACHNVHGSPTRAMVRHGELISSYDSTDKVPSMNFSYLVPYTPPYATASWAPSLTAGTYDVYAWWVEGTNRATNARYTVTHSSGSVEVTVNQRTGGGQWNLLGRYDFAAGTSGNVSLTNEDADGYVMADAIGWDSNLDGTPDIIIDNTDPGFSTTGDCLGDWTCTTGVTGAYDSSHCYHIQPGPQTDTAATLEQSVGGRFGYAAAQTNMNGVCRACHHAISYVRPPTNVVPRIVMQKAEPYSVSNNGIDTVLFTAYVYSPDDSLTGVNIDLTPLDGGASQTMYDDGTNGDLVAGDRIYSYLTTVPGTVGTGLKHLTVTGMDSAARTGTRDIEFMVANQGWTVVDNWEADFRGEWTSSTSGDIYGKNTKYHAAGTGSDTAAFTPALAETGNYNVYAWWTSQSNRASNAAYQINHSSGVDTVTVNQQTAGGEFIFLGTYHFNAQPGYISVVVDNQDAVFTGTWQTSMYSVYYGRDLRYIQSTATGNNTARFTPDLPQTGSYDVYAWWTSHSNRAANVPYTIHFSGGAVDTVRVNQEKGEGGWQYLGTYSFEAGTDGYVEISDEAELDEYIMADAIKWQRSAAKQGIILGDGADGYVMADAVLFEPQP